MGNIVILGAGMMSYGLIYDLNRSNNIGSLTIADSNEKAAQAIAKKANIPTSTKIFDANSYQAICNVINDHNTAISALPYTYNFDVAKACIDKGVNMVDLGGNLHIVQKQMALNEKAVANEVTIIPNLGLAPGLMNILAMGAFHQFSKVESLKIRVGGLPQKLIGPLGYQLTFNPEGLINEYREPCEVLRDFKHVTIDPLSELEDISFPDPYNNNLEAFATSGGSSSLPSLLKGKVRELDYKTIRYKGHYQKIKLLKELGLFRDDFLRLKDSTIRPRDVLSKLLWEVLPQNQPDVVLARLSIQGELDKKKSVTLVNDLIDYFDPESNLTAMMKTTAFPTSIVALMLLNNEISIKGVVPAEIAVDSTKLKKELAHRNIIIQETIKPN